MSAADEVTCSICLEDFKDPVTTLCGHSFCQGCINQSWGEGESDFCCPQCRETFPQKNLRPNRELRKRVELRRRSQAVGKLEGEGVCERHQEALKLFCEEDQVPVCLVCRESRDHRTHAVLPIEEAAKDYQEQIQSRLKELKKERDKLLQVQYAEEKESEKLTRQVELERQLKVYECERLRQLLAERERLLLARLGDLDGEIMRWKKDSVACLEKEISQLSALITELEGKCQQPAPELLQGVRSIMYRAEKATLKCSALISNKLSRKARDFPQGSSLQTVLKEFVGSFSQRVSPWMRDRRAVLAVCIALAVCLFKIQGMPPAKFANVVLNRDTANPTLILSADRKLVRKGKHPQSLARNPSRFDIVPCVLGEEGFDSGRHYWDVEPTGETGWAVGVARHSVMRKSSLSFNPEEGIWAVHQLSGQFQTHTSPENTLPLSRSSARIRVYLDYEAGLVGFYDAENEAPICRFTASFIAEKVFPFFAVWSPRAEIQLTPPDTE